MARRRAATRWPCVSDRVLFAITQVTSHRGFGKRVWMSARIACCQIAPNVEDPGRNASLALDAIQRAVAGGAQIVVLPELATSGYLFRSAEEARAVAVPADGDLLRGLGEAAAPGRALVVCGFCERGADGRVFNSAALLDGSEVLATYRKLHLWGDEKRWFAAGEHPAPVVQT